MHGVAPPYPRFFGCIKLALRFGCRFAGASPHTPSLTCDAARAGGRGVAPYTCPFGRVWGRFQTVKGVFVKATPLQIFPLDCFSAPLRFVHLLMNFCIKRCLRFQAGIGIAQDFAHHHNINLLWVLSSCDLLIKPTAP